MIEDEDVEYVDIRFTDPRGKLQHVTVMADQVDEDFLEEGFMFDGSSIAGWKSIDQSDMKLMPDSNTCYVDPFYAEKTLAIHCSVVEPDTGEAYDRDPRGTAKKAEAYLIASGIGDQSFFGQKMIDHLFLRLLNMLPLFLQSLLGLYRKLPQYLARLQNSELPMFFQRKKDLHSMYCYRALVSYRTDLSTSILRLKIRQT